MYATSSLSVPFIVMETTDLMYDLKLHWHRRFDNDSRSIWLRDELATVFAQDPQLDGGL